MKAAIVTLSALFLWGCSSSLAGSASVAPPDDRQIVDVGNAPVRGASDAKVTLVEFSDFQCPYCEAQEHVLTKILAANADTVRLAYKEFPLPMHKWAELAAEAALAANAQGKFWAFHDTLFAHQDALTQTDLEGYAADLGLSVTDFHAALNAHAYQADVAADEAQGESLGVQGTPTIFVNGRMAFGLVDEKTLAAAIDEELAL